MIDGRVNVEAITDYAKGLHEKQVAQSKQTKGVSVNAKVTIDAEAMYRIGRAYERMKDGISAHGRKACSHFEDVDKLISECEAILKGEG